MKRTLLIGFVLALLGFADYALAQQALERAEAPVYRDGDWWVFRVSQRDWRSTSSSRLPDGDYEVVYGNGKVTVFELMGNEKAAIGRAQGVNVFPLPEMIGLIRKGNAFLQFPLFVGKKWTGQYQDASYYLGGNTSSILMLIEANVAGIEEVTTPRGRFRAFKIQRDDISTETSYYSRTYFYSPESKSIVRYLLDSTLTTRGYPSLWGGKTEIELIKFGSKAPRQ